MKPEPLLKSETPSPDLLGLHVEARAELLKARVSSYTRKDGVFVAEHHDNRSAARPDTPAQKVKAALYDGDKAALGRHAVGDKVVSSRYSKSGVVKGSRDGRVVVEHAGGYTESYRHQDLSPAGDKGTKSLKERLAAKPAAAPAPDADLPDEHNPAFSLSTLSSDHLAAAASGKHDLNKHAKIEMAERGLGADGSWVGFKKAPAAHGLSDSDMAGAKSQQALPVSEHFQTLHPKVLSAAASGKFDLNAHAKKEAANRGIDQSGKWVGFDKAKAIHGGASHAPMNKSDAGGLPLLFTKAPE